MPRKRFSVEQIINHLREAEVLGQSRTSQRYQAVTAADEKPLTAAIVRLASQYGRYGQTFRSFCDSVSLLVIF